MNGLRNVRRSFDTSAAWIASRFRNADISIFHEFHPPPYGGGNQFLLGLRSEMEKRGLRVEVNAISRTTRACLYNSFNFDFRRLRRFARTDCRMVHRVDGPLSAYRGFDDGTDGKIWEINNDWANATVFQSEYSLNKHRELGMEFTSPVIVPNAADPSVFHPYGRIPFSRDRKIRLISTSWSDNPNKGADLYRNLSEALDRKKFEYTFVGRSQIRFDRIRMLDPVASHDISGLLREHDIFITASRNDPCSNSVIEALSCGLPCLYLNSGGHPELVKEAGLPFENEEHALAQLHRLVEEYEERQARISVVSLQEVAARYLSVLRIAGADSSEEPGMG